MYNDQEKYENTIQLTDMDFTFWRKRNSYKVCWKHHRMRHWACKQLGEGERNIH